MSRKRTKRTRRRKDRPIYTTGQKNAIIDDLLHPLQKQHWIFEAVDTLAHFVVEGNIEESIIKFSKYSLPKILRKLLFDEDDDSQK